MGARVARGNVPLSLAEKSERPTLVCKIYQSRLSDIAPFSVTPTLEPIATDNKFFQPPVLSGSLSLLKWSINPGANGLILIN